MRTKEELWELKLAPRGQLQRRRDVCPTAGRNWILPTASVKLEMELAPSFQKGTLPCGPFESGLVRLNGSGLENPAKPTGLLTYGAVR